MKTSEILIIIFILLFALGSFIFYIWVQVDAYDDCRGRGHSAGWCLTAKQRDIGE